MQEEGLLFISTKNSCPLLVRAKLMVVDLARDERMSAFERFGTNLLPTIAVT